ncbi:glycosyltransferase [Paracoccus albus]|uniref:glycosyltransferase n=1 Tax=Paracoccus albus TaxID=3017784 RepID=UPI0022F0DA29|nr:glycosyltransferase [Paracoccus albus]WBU59761.1 glycosyltransferase [Paracoccus albus]
MLLKEWRKFLEEHGEMTTVITLRHPAEVAASLAKRDGLSADHAYLCWIAHNLAAINNSDGMKRALVLFPDWTKDVPATLRRIASLSESDFSYSAVEGAAMQFDRSILGYSGELIADDPEIAALAGDLFELLKLHSKNCTVPEAEELLPFMRRFETASRTARGVETFLQTKLTQLGAYAAQCRQDALSLQNQVRDTTAERNLVVAELEAQRDAANERLAQLQQSVGDGGQDIREAKVQLDHMKAELDRNNKLVTHLTTLLNRERHTVLKPIYRHLHRHGGRLLRLLLPPRAFDWIKRSLPYPGSIPGYLAYAPSHSIASATHGYGAVPAAAGNKPDIFIMSIINWDFRIQRPQHLATAFGRAGHRVFYVEMETVSGSGSAREVAQNVFVLRLPARGMHGVTPYCGTVSPASIRAWVDHFYDAADAIGSSQYAHIVVEHPYWWNFVRHLSPQFQITFDCMDDISGFSNTDEALLKLEADMAEHADRMIVSSQYLFDKYSENRPVKLIRNGADIDHFMHRDDTLPIPSFLNGKLRGDTIRVGYVGAIAEWFDAELIAAVAKANPDFDFHLCGAVTAPEPARLADAPNISMYGEIPYDEVPGFLKAMDVLIIPFRLLPIIKACDPVKFYEYSAMQRPTVATALPELARAGDLVTTASEPEEFAKGIRNAAVAGSDAALRADLVAYANRNTWGHRATDFLEEIEDAALVSVVILSFGSADLTLNCIQSLTGKGDTYPNLEILIVDNGSSPCELAKIRQEAARHPGIQLIENGENLGFAAGNNVGIKAAKGEYVLLLNNDTYIAPGAIAAMVRHLQRNARIGIVGPLTNNIGNEARIVVEYNNISEMACCAREIVTGYRGLWTEINVAAYFCAMFRKADLERLGGLSTDYGLGMFEDDDHCAHFRASGLIPALAEDAFVHHDLSATFDAMPEPEKTALFEKNRKIYEARWGEWRPHSYRDTRPKPSLPKPK